jgi:hypothetical protein
MDLMSRRSTFTNPAPRLALVAATLTLAITASAFGQAPERDHVDQFFSGVIDCGSFQDVYVEEEIADLVWFFDADGRPLRFVVHVSQYSTDVNSVTGLTLHERNRHLYTFDFATGEVTLDGAIVRATLPGEGIVLHDIGRLRFGFEADGTLDFTFAAGHHDALIGGRDVCEALA